MLALAIVVSLLVLIAFLRFGVIVEYNEEGFLLWAKAGFIKFKLLDKDKKKKKPKKKPKEKKKTDLKALKPGSLSEFMDTLRAVKKTLDRLRRRLLIKKLIIYYTSAGEDPANTAIMFGAANAVFGAIIPVLERSFRIRRRDLRAMVDFNAKEQGIYANVSISIAVWEVIYVLAALLPIITAIFKKPRDNQTRDNKTINNKKDRKDGKENGATPDKRVDGNNNEENERDD